MGLNYTPHRCYAGFYFDDLEEYWEAIAELSALLVQTPDDHVALNNRGLMHLEIGQEALAERDLKASCILATADPLPHENLGSLLEKRGEHDLAIQSYQRALDIAPDRTTARATLARIRSGGERSENS